MQGLKHVHDSGFMHLDLKPANIFIDFRGKLKIGDFGMATSWPAPPGLECEGDREYIGPEILMGLYDKPSDIFSLGLIMVEIAGNVELPDNGPTWQKLRSGDFSDVPSLTTGATGSSMQDVVSGRLPTPADIDMDIESYDSDMEGDMGSPIAHRRHSINLDNLRTHDASNLFGQVKQPELLNPPAFMKVATHKGALDAIVRWMILPNPEDRPTISQLLETESLTWIEGRNRGGATIFEGNWGPAAGASSSLDSEMTDI